MQIAGALNRSFGNFLTLRGIAEIHDLEKVSEANPGYQRNLKPKQVEKMKNFLESGDYTFFPELILSIALDDDEGKYASEAAALYGSTSIDSNRLSGRFQFGDFNLHFNRPRGTSNLVVGQFEPKDTSKPILQRIDGNHRLAVAKDITKQLQVPFCIIFYIDSQIVNKSNRVIFNNINFKHIPLTTEENLRLVFEDIFTDEELSDPVWFGKDYLQARQLFKSISLENLDALKSILCDEQGEHQYTRTVLLNFAETYKNRVSKGEFQNALQEINKFLASYSSNGSYQLVTAMLYYYFENKLPMFSKWVDRNYIYELKQVDASGLIAIYDKIFEAKRRTIFLAMQFGQETEENYDAIKKAVDEVNNEIGEDLKLEHVRIDDLKTGYSFAITDEILEHIETGGYFIADITLGNPNVFYEIGYQMGLNKGKGLLQNNFLLVHNESISRDGFDVDKSFNISNISIEKASSGINLMERVKVQIKEYYGFS